MSELSVVLVADSNNPSILNPDFLKIHGIVSHDSTLKDPPICTPAFSQVTFADGITIRADPARVTFEQSADPLDAESVRCVDSARQYIKTVPHVRYKAMGINPKGYRVSQDVETGNMARILIERGQWTAFQDVVPEFKLTSVYSLSDKKVTFTVFLRHLAGGNPGPVLVFEANVHRDVQAANQMERIRSFDSILRSWKRDLGDFREIVNRFDTRIRNAESR